MGGDETQDHQNRAKSNRLGTRHARGEIVEVQGGHIARSLGRKDRHSKVCTAKGLRDRRVRLSAHAAIQFYDVQDRLGYDRPSMAVDWLIEAAKSAIDELAELPSWKPTLDIVSNVGLDGNQKQLEQPEQQQQQFGYSLSGISSNSWLTTRTQQMNYGNLSENNPSFFSMGAFNSSGILFNSLPLPQPLLGQNQFVFSQGGPLQSSNTQSVRDWTDPSSSSIAAASAANHYEHHHHNSPHIQNRSLISLPGLNPCFLEVLKIQDLVVVTVSAVS
ncbi:hypothetical protein Vadar_020758 [Vaccinium darrowii]|uniref:Uncharacterized protein n=1 Tax=Vaccinium darrowii TaxID=229202 RepID=A0ACB7Z4Z7_9ERIC|nr:hypothetical protein Vadar_020758 [Vaccinium darrowii]